jgi:hypothetical protein
MTKDASYFLTFYALVTIIVLMATACALEF